MSMRSDQVDKRLAALIDGFDRYVDAYDRLVPFDGRQLAAHRQTVALRQDAGTVEAAVHDQDFLISLRQTLKAWGIGVRASRLLPEDKFAAALQAAAPPLMALEKFTIDSPNRPDDTADRLLEIIRSIQVVDNQAKLVAGTKTLHHLLPDLVPPMDRQWTGLFFGLYPPQWQPEAGQARIFHKIYDALTDVACRTHPLRNVTGQRWRTSRTKILDNALIGFCKIHLTSPLNDSSEDVEPDDATQIFFEVDGLPPAKSEALSMLGAGHSHAPRVRRLLRAAQRACQECAFTPVEHDPIALDVMVHAAPNEPPWDATNYLGGIADVLENKSHRGALPHLSELANVWLYRNDRQIKQITYHQRDSDHSNYTIALRRITTSENTTRP